MGLNLHQGTKVLLPACLLSAVCFAVVNSTKDLAALKMPLSILHPQKNYLICSKKPHHPTTKKPKPLQLHSWYHIFC